MVATIFADTTTLLEAIAAGDEQRIIGETLDLLGQQQVLPATLAGRVGLAALWGGCEPHRLAAYAAVGRVAEWMRAIPAGSEPREDALRLLAPATPLAQGFLAIGPAVRAGVAAEAHPALPEPLMPDKVRNPDGALGGLRDAFARRDLVGVQRILLGYDATGTDYRAVISSIFTTLQFRYPEAGHPVIFTHAGMRILGMAGWGGNQPALITWLAPLLLDDAPDLPAAQAARAYAAAPEHDLGWLRTRLSIPKEEAAGAQYQRALLAGDAQAACEATLAALRAGATPPGVAAGMELAIASRLTALPEGDRAGLLRAAHALQYAHAVHVALTEVQDPVIWPILYTAAAVTSTLGGAGAAPAIEGVGGATVPALPGGGLIAPVMLRTFEQQLSQRDAAGAYATARRYVRMGHAPRALAGMLGAVVAQTDLAGGQEEALHLLPSVTAAADGYLMLPAALAKGGGNPLLAAALRLASELGGPHAIADRVGAAVSDAAVSDAAVSDAAGSGGA